MRSEIHPIIASAAAGRLPEWAVVGPQRLRHLAAVAALLARWAAELHLSEDDRLRWSACGWLHDALRDADPDSMAREAGDFPTSMRHGPAAAARLKAAGVSDSELLEAVAYHSIGRSRLRRLGGFLYLADYLEPGRSHQPQILAAWRVRLPHDHRAALRWVCERRIAHAIDRGRALHPATVGFWNELVEDG
jgi:HD superfamily phosphohydrolase YqeK